MTSTEPLAVGSLAPDFTLRDQRGAEVSLAELRRERAVVLVFYPYAFSGICTGELSEIRDDLGTFENDDVTVLALSCDPRPTLLAWASAEGYFFPLLSDFWAHGEVARAYGVFDETEGCARRGTFLVDRDGRVAWSLVAEIGERRDFSGLRARLAELSSDTQAQAATRR